MYRVKVRVHVNYPDLKYFTETYDFHCFADAQKCAKENTYESKYNHSRTAVIEEILEIKE